MRKLKIFIRTSWNPEFPVWCPMRSTLQDFIAPSACWFNLKFVPQGSFVSGGDALTPVVIPNAGQTANKSCSSDKQAFLSTGFRSTFLTLTFPISKIFRTLSMASSISSAGGSTWVLLAPSENPPYLQTGKQHMNIWKLLLTDRVHDFKIKLDPDLNSFTHTLFFKL